MKKLNTNHQVVRRLLERYPRGSTWMRMFLMLLIMIMTSAFAMAQETYGIKIAGEDITGYNRYDLTEISGVSGKVYFDPNTRTLTLDNATIEADGCNAILNETCDYLTIELIGTNNIDVTGAAGINLKEETTIWSNSGGKLSVKSEMCALLFGGCPLEIKNCWLEAEGRYGISARNNVAEEVLTIRNSHVEAKGSKGSICEIANLVLNYCSIIQPDGARFNTQNNAVVLNGKRVTDKVVIEPDYGIKIADKPVTTLNYKDLSVIDGVEGKISYDPENKILTMEDVTINVADNSGIWNGSVKDLKIAVVGNNTITTNNACIKIFETSTISGSGTLKLKSKMSSGIDVESSLTVEDIKLYADGKWGVDGYDGKSGEILTLRNAYVEATGYYGSMWDLQDLVLDGCTITQPEGAAFDTNKHAVSLNFKNVTDMVIEPSYGIKIAGKEVSRYNCKDLSVIDGVDGKISYDPETTTLTMEDVTINVADLNGIVNKDVKGLKIKLFGNNAITANNACISIQKTSTISGSGTLRLKSSGHCGLHLPYSPLTVEGVKLYAEGKWGIAGYNGRSDEILTLRNAYVEATGRLGSVCDLQNLILDGCSIIQPEGAAFAANVDAVALNGEVVTDKVVIAPDNLGFEIAGEKVTRKNCKDLSVIKGVSGTVSYDPNTKTLTLDNATIINEDEGYGKGIVNKNISDFTIRLIGENTVTTGRASLVLNQPSTITGEGSLSLSSQKYCGLDMEAASVLIDNTKLFVRGAYGIAGYVGAETEVLTVRNSYVEAEGFALGSIVFLSNLILEDCSITQPDGAEFDAQKKAVVLNGEEIKSKVVIAPITNGISDITTDVPAHAKGIYSVTGVKQTLQWNELPAGIYIVDGVKRVKK